MATTASEGSADALGRLAPRLMEFGVTRVGDITGLDTIGLPVWFACRPNSRCLSVAQGKGLDDGSARLSAVMEALEGAVAERAEALTCEIGSIEDVRKRGRVVIPIEAMMRVSPGRLDPRRERRWTAGASYATGERVLAPYELIGMDMSADARCDHAAFHMSSIGLAAGLNATDATLHALLELVENDATTPFEIFGAAATAARPVDVEPGRHAGLDQALAKLHEAGIEPQFFEIGRDIRLPVIGALVPWPAAAAPADAGVRRCAGFACRPDPAAAALAALLEAVQSRLTCIAGARDDLPDEAYAWPAPRDRIERRPAVTLDALRSAFAAEAHADPESRVREVCAAIGAAGATDVYVFDLNPGDRDFSVVRVLAPSLDAGGAAGNGRLRPRSLASLDGRRRS